MAEISNNIKGTINLTGYRLLILLQLLMQGKTSKEDIIKVYEENEYLKEISQDTIRLDINTLKNAGFEIENEDIGDKYVYNLKSNPLELKYTDKDIKIINRIKKVALDLWNWKDIISLYKTFEKISHFIREEDFRESILNFGYFMQINFSLLKELHKHCLNKNEIVLKYNSPKNGIMHIRMRTLWIEHDKNTNKLHLLGQFENYNYISYLRIDKIIKIEQVFIKPTIKLLDKKYKIYKVKNSLEYEPNFNEEIIEETPEYLTIKTTIINDFQYVQRILSLGDNIIEIDKDTKSLVLKNLLETREVYR